MLNNKNRMVVAFNTLLAISLLSLGFYPQSAVTAAATTSTVEVKRFTEGALVKGTSPNVYLVTADGTRRWITDEATFNTFGYAWSAIVAIDDVELELYPPGEPLIAEVKPTAITAAEIEVRVREYFSDVPEMISIAKCESRFR